MTEEVRPVEPTEGGVPQNNEEVTEAPALSADEERASGQGWQPKEDWEAAGKDPNQWRSAKEFLDRGELLDKISSQGRELKQVQAIVSQLSEQNRQVYKAGYDKALKDLRGAKAQALKDENYDAVVQIDEAIATTKENIKKIEAAPASQPVAQETAAFSEFKRNNGSWYNDSNVALKHWAHGMALEYANKNPNAREEDVYAYIEKEVKKIRPNDARRGPPSPDGDGTRGANGPKGSNAGGPTFEKLMASLPEDQARVARDMVKRGIISKEKYVQDYEAIGR